MKVNTDSLVMMLKFAGGMLAILGIIFGLACATPWLAKQVDKLRKKKPDNEKKDAFPDVKGIYDAQTPEDAENENSGTSDAEETSQKVEQP